MLFKNRKKLFFFAQEICLEILLLRKIADMAKSWTIWNKNRRKVQTTLFHNFWKIQTKNSLSNERPRQIEGGDNGLSVGKECQTKRSFYQKCKNTSKLVLHWLLIFH